MERSEQTTRDRAILVVRIATFSGVLSAVGITWLFGNLAEAYFSGKPAPAPRPPLVPVAAAPKQSAPTVITTVVHHAAGSQPAAPVAGNAPRPPAQGPAPAPPPPPPPVCHSTPSHPC